jgi:hypothetical protein
MRALMGLSGGSTPHRPDRVRVGPAGVSGGEKRRGNGVESLPTTPRLHPAVLEWNPCDTGK